MPLLDKFYRDHIAQGLEIVAVSPSWLDGTASATESGKDLKMGLSSTCRSASFALVGVLFVATSAFAHSYPKTAQPPMNGTVKTPPSEVVIDFTGDLEPKLSTFEVLDAQGVRADTGGAHTDPGDAKRMRVGLKPLQPGTYTVAWHVTSVDTHRTEGKFVFTIAP